MYSNFNHASYGYGYPYGASPYFPYARYSHPVTYTNHTFGYATRQTISGQATWTDGGAVTKCGIPWSSNRFMTAAVGQNAPYQCGQTIKVKNPSNQRVVLVTVVDQVPGFPETKINLHRKAFETLGANVDAGIINVEITPNPQLEEEKWGKYLLEIAQSAYPNYQPTDYNKVSESEPEPNQVKEVYKFVMQSPQETMSIEGTVIYNPATDRILSINFKEV